MSLVFVYKNSRLNNYSIRSEKIKRVIDRRKKLILKNVKFKVSKAGRERVLREKRKNVHAGVLGEFCNEYFPWKTRKKTLIGQVFYNPYIADYFYLENGEKIEKADIVIMNESGVFAYGRQYSS